MNDLLKQTLSELSTLAADLSRQAGRVSRYACPATAPVSSSRNARAPVVPTSSERTKGPVARAIARLIVQVARGRKPGATLHRRYCTGDTGGPAPP